MIFEAKDQLLSAAGAGILLGDRHMGGCVCVCLYVCAYTQVRDGYFNGKFYQNNSLCLQEIHYASNYGS